MNLKYLREHNHVLAFCPSDLNIVKGYDVVLAYFPEEKHRGAWTKFVVWGCDRDGNCFWGTYTDSYARALRDFAERTLGTIDENIEPERNTLLAS